MLLKRTRTSFLTSDVLDIFANCGFLKMLITNLN